MCIQTIFRKEFPIANGTFVAFLRDIRMFGCNMTFESIFLSKFHATMVTREWFLAGI